MTRRAPEQALHRAVAQFLALALPADAWFTTMPLGGGGYNHGARNKALGALKGTPDILGAHRGRPIAIELKAPRGRLSPAQALCHTRMIEAGWFVCVARSLAEVEEALRGLGVPLRARSL